MNRVAIVAVLVQAGLIQAGQQPRFTATTSLVRLEVSVADDRGAVQGLQSGKFVVIDSGLRQTVTVEEVSDAPLDLVLVAQPLASVAYTSAEQAPRVAAGLTAFLGQVQGRDRLGAIVASAPPALLRPLAFGPPAFSVTEFTDGSYAAPFDAIAAALREFEQTDRRRALIAFTNAADFRSTISFGQLAGLAQKLGPAFVLVGSPVKVKEDVRWAAETTTGLRIGEPVVATVSGYVFPATLELLARRTGGITVNLGSGDPAKLIEDMFTWLRTRYIVSYAPPAGKGWHPVSVTVNHRGAKVTVREGYFVD